MTASIAQGVAKQLRVKKESTLNVAPGATGAQLLRRTTSEFSLTKQTYQSQEIRPDYQISDFRHGGRSVSGQLNGELSCLTYADFFAAAFRAPFATAAGLLRADIAAFPDPNPFLRPDFDRVAHWRAWPSSLGDGLKVGLTWTSMLATGRRARAYSPFSSWGEILKAPGAVFVSLQYTDPSEAIALARDAFGVTVHVPPGINLRNDLDDLCALCTAMDLVFGAMNATTNIAAGAGVETWVLARAQTAWSMLGSDHLPWYPSVRLFAKPSLDTWDGVLTEIAAAMRQRVGG